MKTRIAFAILIAMCLSVSDAQEKLRNGHSLKTGNLNRQISVEVILITIPEKDFVSPSLQSDIRASPRPQDIRPPEVSAKDLDEAGGIQLVAATTTIEKRQPVFAETISESKRRAMMEEFQLAPSANIMFAPKVTVFDEQVATIQDTTSRPFVVGVDTDDSAAKPEPKPDILTVEEGTKFALRSTIRRGDVVQLDLGMRLSDLREVDVVSAGTNKAVQVPTVRETVLSLSANVKPGETLAVWGFETIERVEVETRTFSGVPLLSRAFVNKAVAEGPVQAMLLVRPTVIDVTDETAPNDR